ncbi:hypothetical protein MSHOH_2151 [Methanosarcina horonobensis HB-1 = JCM 15518]|uniref:Uncharacterized protein n=1 Tax=Methanosarcina horonobensis HB-1 = JCM 15518 TaxID=1434110 RepID=A0A0E3SAB7_9EURY|nr:hypothetical protein [Methanosarcina horonobensis]AKB78634.1 hypothetical protein MSHOH_2151 [Methanosarcina horonobensis HB-1 = JCM 15518]
MISSIYIFFGFVTLLIFFLAFYDFGATRSRAAILPALLSFALGIMMCAFSWNITSLSGGVELSALQGWESYALSGFWFIITVIGFLLTMVIVLETPKDILE